MRQKLKDVETFPFMLAIYKDNEHGHLIRHALSVWKYNSTRNILQTHPLHYCEYPPMELVLEYRNEKAAMGYLNSKHLKCPKVTRWAFEIEFDNLALVAVNSRFTSIGAIPESGLGYYVLRMLSIIEYDDDLIYKIITSDLATHMHPGFYDLLNEEQRATLVICS